MKLPKKSIWREVVAVILVLAVIVAVWAVTRQNTQPIPNPSAATSQTKPQPTPEKMFTMAAMGDMLAHDSVVAQAKKTAAYDFTPYFTHIRPTLATHDVVFCNPETPVAGAQLGISGYPAFNAPSEFARDLTASGCGVINLATNHIYDKAQAGVDASRTVWEQQDVLAVHGANSSAEQQKKVSYFEKNGVKCAFVAFADFSNRAPDHPYSINFYHDEALVRQLLGEARQKADVVIVSAHWGTEDATTVNDDQRKAAALFADLGADIVIGTGPHVVQPVEQKTGKNGHTTLVWYSLGNMLSSQLQVNQLTGIVASMRVTKKAQGISIDHVVATPTFMSYEWPQADRAAERLSTRSNLQLRSLKAATPDIPGMFPGESYDTRQQFVSSTLGELVTIQE